MRSELAGSRQAVVLRTDAQGHVVKQASVASIPAHWADPVAFTVAAYERHLGGRLHSVYLRGSVPLGQPRDFVSDLDTFAVVAGDDHPRSVSWELEHGAEVGRRWPFVKGVEVSVYPIADVWVSRLLAAMIKVHGACVHGDDLTRRIRGFKPGIELLFHSWDLPRDLEVARRVIDRGGDQASIDETCVWITKRILRCGFELVMRRAGCLTRDLVASYEMFLRYYPLHETAMAEVLALALAGGGPRARCLRAIETVDDWLYAEICLEYGAARIEQLLAKA